MDVRYFEGYDGVPDGYYARVADNRLAMTTVTDGLVVHEPTASREWDGECVIKCACGWVQDWKHETSWLDHYRAAWTLTGQQPPELRQAAGAVLDAVRRIPIALGPHEELTKALDVMRKALDE